VGHDGAWSPDSEKIVFANGNELYLAKSDGTERRKLADVPGIANWPRWSPDGATVRFTVVDTRTNLTSLWQVSVNGADLHRCFPAGTTLPRNAAATGLLTEIFRFPVWAQWQDRRLGVTRT